MARIQTISRRSHHMCKKQTYDVRALDHECSKSLLERGLSFQDRPFGFHQVRVGGE